MISKSDTAGIFAATMFYAFVLRIFFCLLTSLSLHTPAFNPEDSDEEKTLVMGGVIIPIEDDESEASDSTSSLLAQISDEQLFLEVTRRLKRVNKVIEQREMPQSDNTCAQGFRAYLFLKDKIKAIKPYTMPIILMGGITTILADAITYGAPEIIANTLALGTMGTGISMALIYALCRYYHYHCLKQR